MQKTTKSSTKVETLVSEKPQVRLKKPSISDLVKPSKTSLTSGLSNQKDKIADAKQDQPFQKPQLLIPKGGSFDIGIIQESDKIQIPLATVKPVFVRATLLEETKKRDVLKLSKEINDKLNDISGKGDEKNAIIFVDTDDYPESKKC